MTATASIGTEPFKVPTEARALAGRVPTYLADAVYAGLADAAHDLKPLDVSTAVEELFRGLLDAGWAIVPSEVDAIDRSSLHSGTVGNAAVDSPIGRLWGLWDMLKVYADEYVQLGREIHDEYASLYFNDPSSEGRWKEPDERANASLRAHLMRLLKHCEALDLAVSKTLIEARIHTLPKTSGEYEVLINAITAELKQKLFLFVPPHLAKYYENDALVSDQTAKAFPKASEEIRSSASCLALGRFTASVFHSMRAAEIGLRSMNNAFPIALKGNKPIELAEWREVIDALATVARDIENRPNADPKRETDQQFVSEASAQFRFFKNGWRIRVAHARATYDEAQALEAFEHVKSFFEVLSTRVAE